MNNNEEKYFNIIYFNNYLSTCEDCNTTASTIYTTTAVVVNKYIAIQLSPLG